MVSFNLRVKESFNLGHSNHINNHKLGSIVLSTPSSNFKESNND